MDQGFDWEIREWSINDAYIRNSKGEKIIDIKDSNLHVMSYSKSINKTLYKDLLKNLYSLTNYPDWIPYRTSYYKGWGFCCSDNLINSESFLNLLKFLSTLVMTLMEITLDGGRKKGEKMKF